MTWSLGKKYDESYKLSLEKIVYLPKFTTYISAFKWQNICATSHQDLHMLAKYNLLHMLLQIVRWNITFWPCYKYLYDLSWYLVVYLVWKINRMHLLWKTYSWVPFIYKTHFWKHALKTRFLFSRSMFFYKPHFLKPHLKTHFY